MSKTKSAQSVQQGGATRGHFGQGRTGTVRQASALHHTLRGTFHSGHSILGVLSEWLSPAEIDAWHRQNVQPVAFFGRSPEKPRPASPADAAWNGSIQSQHVRLFGNVGNQLRDFADLLRRFAQALDALGGVLNLVTDPFIPPMAFCTAAGPGQQPAAIGAPPRPTPGLGPTLVNAGRHVQNGAAGFTDLAQLLGRSGQQFVGCCPPGPSFATRVAVFCTLPTSWRSSSTV